MSFSKKQGAIYMSNHVSIDDISVLHQKLPQNVKFILFNKREFTHNEGKLKNRQVVIFEQLDARAIIEISKIVENGEPILIFPEIKISKTGSLLRIYSEFAFLAHKTNAVIYPVFIHSESRSSLYPNALRFVESLVPYSKSYVRVGSPFTLKNFSTATGEVEKERIAAFIHTQLNNLKFNSLHKKDVNLYNELLLASKTFKDNEYIVKDTSGQVSYSKLLLNINVMSQRLERELTEPRVGVLLPSSIAHVVTLYSLFKLNVTPAILNFTMDEQNLNDCCETAEIKTIITSSAFIEKGNLESLISSLEKKYKIVYLENVKDSINSGDKLRGLVNNYLPIKSHLKSSEMILFTSGSENKPKGVVLTHDNIYANILQALTVMDLTTQDKMFNALPMFHSFGLTVGTILPIVSGIPTYLYPAPTHSKEIPRTVYEEDLTLFISTPTFLNHYERYAHPLTFHNVRYVIAGAEQLKDETRIKWMERYGKKIFEGYGATEGSPILALNTPLYNKVNSVGKVFPGMEFKLNPIEGIERGGSLLVKGPNMMKGYLIHGKGFIPLNDWYDTGDVVEVDEDNYITIKSRLKRFAKIGGEMVSLNQVEELASKCFEHTNFAAVVLPDKRKGEKIILFTLPLEDEKTFKTLPKTLKKFIKTNKLSSLLIPAEIRAIEEIPLLGSGKTDYVSLQKVAKDA
ncbi:AMP-binding protein [Priestia filamentosa]|uniref:AMP-binding protein n=1 Tax=Priestia filamentosa TaxID=1402861 RepID=UPI003978F7D6